MQKHERDRGTIKEFVVPDNIKELISKLETQAAFTYPDHKDSREKLFRESLIMTLSHTFEALTLAKLSTH